jgi:nucleotide-binding universal stress UspA family protein
MASIRRLLLPTDFSTHADFAWPYPLTFARQFGAELTVLYDPHAQDSAVDLIVMAARSTAAPHCTIPRSTIERVVRGASCPVFVVQSAAPEGSPRLAATG